MITTQYHASLSEHLNGKSIYGLVQYYNSQQARESLETHAAKLLLKNRAENPRAVEMTVSIDDFLESLVLSIKYSRPGKDEHGMVHLKLNKNIHTEKYAFLKEWLMRDMKKFCECKDEIMQTVPEPRSALFFNVYFRLEMKESEMRMRMWGCEQLGIYDDSQYFDRHPLELNVGLRVFN